MNRATLKARQRPSNTRRTLQTIHYPGHAHQVRASARKAARMRFAMLELFRLAKRCAHKAHRYPHRDRWARLEAQNPPQTD